MQISAVPALKARSCHQHLDPVIRVQNQYRAAPRMHPLATRPVLLEVQSTHHQQEILRCLTHQHQTLFLPIRERLVLWLPLL